MHRTLEVKTQPLLYTAHSTSLRQIEEEHQIQHDGRGENTVSAQEINFDLHGITEPSIDVDVVPTFFVISSRRIVVDAYFMGEILIKVRIKLGLKNLVQNRKLALLFCFKGIR